MKKTTLSIIVLTFIISLIVCGAYAATKSDQDKLNRQHVVWVKKCLQDFKSIKPGMKRSEIDKKFQTDGGLTGGPYYVRFKHPSCHYFKIDVTFKEKKRNADDQNRVGGRKKTKLVTYRSLT
ncbi:hypothetical protein ES703_76316 [subsurface metagenome]